MSPNGGVGFCRSSKKEIGGFDGLVLLEDGGGQ